MKFPECTNFLSLINWLIDVIPLLFIDNLPLMFSNGLLISLIFIDRDDVLSFPQISKDFPFVSACRRGSLSVLCDDINFTFVWSIVISGWVLLPLFCILKGAVPFIIISLLIFLLINIFPSIMRFLF